MIKIKNRWLTGTYDFARYTCWLKLRKQNLFYDFDLTIKISENIEERINHIFWKHLQILFNLEDTMEVNIWQKGREVIKETPFEE